MARGLPDYFNPDTLVSQRLANVEEIVTHLRGIASVDNRGRTFWHDNFREGPYGWQISFDGDATAPVGSLARTENPPASLFIDSGTFAGTGTITMAKEFRLLDVVRAGFEVSFLFSEEMPRLFMQMVYHDGVDIATATLRLDIALGYIALNVNGVYTNVYQLLYYHPHYEWLPIKMVVDFSTNKYLRLIVGQATIDVSELAAQVGASGVRGNLQIVLAFSALSGILSKTYLGHATLTVDEP